MKNTRGNILFLILLAVVLFAALSYAVTSSMRGGGKDAGGENLQTKTSNILNFIGQVDAAVMRMRTTGDININTISFQNTQKWVNGFLHDVSAQNSNCLTNACRVFRPEGGGATAQNFETYGVSDPADAVSSAAPGYLNFIGIRFPYAGTDAYDRAMIINKLDPAICVEINKRLDLPDPAAITLAGTAQYDWDTTSLRLNSSIDGPAFLGKDTFGMNITANGITRCYIYHVVIAR